MKQGILKSAPSHFYPSAPSRLFQCSLSGSSLPPVSSLLFCFRENQANLLTEAIGHQPQVSSKDTVAHSVFAHVLSVHLCASMLIGVVLSHCTNLSFFFLLCAYTGVCVCVQVGGACLRKHPHICQDTIFQSRTRLSAVNRDQQGYSGSIAEHIVQHSLFTHTHQ